MGVAIIKSFNGIYNVSIDLIGVCIVLSSVLRVFICLKIYWSIKVLNIVVVVTILVGKLWFNCKLRFKEIEIKLNNSFLLKMFYYKHIYLLISY